MKVGSFVRAAQTLSLSLFLSTSLLLSPPPLSLYFSPFLLFSLAIVSPSRLVVRLLPSVPVSLRFPRFWVDSLWTGSLLAPLVLFPSIPAMPFPNDVSNPEVPQAYHLRYRRLVKGFPLSALYHVAFPSTNPPPPLTFLPASPLSTLLLRLTVFQFRTPWSLFVIRAFSVIRHRCFLFVFFSIPLFFYFTQKSQFCRIIFLFPWAFVLSAFLAQELRSVSLTAYLSSSFIRFPRRIPDIPSFSFSIFLPLSFLPLSILPSLGKVLRFLRGVPPPSCFSRPRWSLLSFYGLLAFIRFPVCSLRVLRLSP